MQTVTDLEQRIARLAPAANPPADVDHRLAEALELHAELDDVDVDWRLAVSRGERPYRPAERTKLDQAYLRWLAAARALEPLLRQATDRTLVRRFRRALREGRLIEADLAADRP